MLHALDRAGKRVDYYAREFDLNELHRTLSAVPKGTFQHIKCYGLHGTYDDGVEWLKKPEVANKPKCVLSMGSSIGNFSPEDVAPFLRAYAKNLRKGDTMIIGIDACNDHEKIYHAYNDRNGVTHAFITNGLANANRIMGPDTFKSGDWKVVGEVDPARGCHQAFVTPIKDVSIRDITVKAGEKIRIEHSYKYSEAESNRLWETTGLAKGAKWSNRNEDYGKLNQPKHDGIRHIDEGKPALHLLLV